MYGKLFKQMYRGTLATRGPWQALVTFQQFIILADVGGIVDMMAESISRETTLPMDIILIGIAELEKPDPDSRSPDAEGRRILRLSETREWGWRITNYEHYRNLKREEDRREYHRQYWHKRKEKASATNSTPTQQTQPSQPMQYAEAEAVSRGKKKEHTAAAPPKRTKRRPAIAVDSPEFLDFKVIYPERAGDYEWSEASRSIHARLAEGHTWNQILDGTKRYAAYARATGSHGTQFVMQASRFVGPKLKFLELWKLPGNKAETLIDANVESSQRWLNEGR